MSTILFNSIVYGPIMSRRLGRSLGINLSPSDSKWCNYDCIYCEIGWNKSHRGLTSLPTVEEFTASLTESLRVQNLKGEHPDVITFAGNGEPTMHPRFAEIIDITIRLRNQYAPGARIAVLTNSTGTVKPSVVEALKKVDDNILKLDSGIMKTFCRLNRPVNPLDPQLAVERFKQFSGRQMVQTMFLRGTLEDGPIDNTVEEELDAWEKLIVEIMPAKVMIYTIDRETPAENLEKIPREEMEHIADRIRRHGIEVSVSA